MIFGVPGRPAVVDIPGFMRLVCHRTILTPHGPTRAWFAVLRWSAMTENVHPNRSGGAAGNRHRSRWVPGWRRCLTTASSTCWNCGPTWPNRRRAASRPWPPGGGTAVGQRPPPTGGLPAAGRDRRAAGPAGRRRGVPVTKLVALIGDRAPRDAVLGALEDLRGGRWCGATPRCGCPPRRPPRCPGIPARSSSGRRPARIGDRRRRQELDEPQRELLGDCSSARRWAAPATRRRAPARSAGSRAAGRGLLRQIDADTVILPRRVGQVLRGEDPGPTHLVPPDPVVSGTTAEDVDAAAAAR